MSAVGVQPKLDAYGRVKVPLTAERKRQIAEEMAEGIVGLYRQELMTRAQEAMVRGQALAAEGETLKKLAEQKKAEAKQHAMNASEHRAKAAEHGAKAAEHGARAAQLRAQKQQIIKVVSSQLLVGVFHGHKNLPTPVVEEIFTKFLAHHADPISIQQEPATKKTIYGAKTTVPFAEYIEANPDKATSCDFRIFNENISDNMAHVSRALSNPNCTISVVWINSKVSEEAKAYLEKAERNRGEAIRNGEASIPLTINFV